MASGYMTLSTKWLDTYHQLGLFIQYNFKKILKLTLAYKFGIFINLITVTSYQMSFSTAMTVFLDWINLEGYWTKLIFDELLMK